MSEQFLIDQLDEAISAIIARQATASSEQPELAALAALGSELRLLPREQFKSSLKETLRRSATMTATGPEKQSSELSPAGHHTVTPSARISWTIRAANSRLAASGL